MKPEMEKYRGLLDCKQTQPMTDKLAALFTKCLLVEMARTQPSHPQHLEVNNWERFESTFGPELSVIAQVMHQRFRAITDLRGVAMHQVLSVELFLFLSILATSPGGAVMWTHAAWTRFCETGQKQTCAVWALEFPQGFPTKEEERRIWVAQKQMSNGDEGDNMIDQFYNWPTPRAGQPAPEPTAV